METCCVTCRYSRYINGELTCLCEESEGYGLETMEGDYCGEWEEREE